MSVGGISFGREAAATIQGRAGQGEGGSFRLRPSMPTKDTLEYVQQLATVVLLLLALGVFTYYLARYPRKALSMALNRVGMKP